MAWKPLTREQEAEMAAEQQTFADELALNTLYPDEEEGEPAEEDDDEKVEEEVRLNAGRKETPSAAQTLEAGANISASNWLRWQMVRI